MRVNVSRDQVMAAFAEVSDDPSFDESRGLVERGGMPAEMIRALTLRPEILRGFAGFGNAVYPGGLLERRVKELVIIESSRRNECQFCVNSHLDLVSLMGTIDEPLVTLDSPDRLSQRERLAVEYTRAVMTDSNAVPDELFDRLHEAFTDPEIVELSFLIGYINMLNLFNNSLQVRYSGDYSALATEAPVPR